MPNIIDSKKPKYQQLADEWRTLILEGAIKPGSQLPSFNEMLAQYGATSTTVERVYTVLAQEGLIVRERRRGVFVAHRDQTVRTGIIGFLSGISPEVSRLPYWSHLMEGIQQEAETQGMQILLFNHASAAKWDQIDGLIIYETWEKIVEGVTYEAWVDGKPRWIPARMPCSVVLAQVNGVCNVVSDDYQAAREITRYLLNRGHQRIAYMSSMLDSISKRRIEGYRDALLAAGIEPQADWLHRIIAEKHEKDHYVGGGYNAMRQWMENGWGEQRFTAMLAHNDDTAIGAIQALREKGIETPDDISVVGFDGHGGDRFFRPRLTTVEVPLMQIGRNAVKQIMQQIASPDTTPSTIMLPARIREGDSVCSIQPSERGGSY